jgi:hypothetical protein
MELLFDHSTKSRTEILREAAASANSGPGPNWIPFWRLKFQRFPESDFKNSVALRPMMIPLQPRPKPRHRFGCIGRLSRVFHCPCPAVEKCRRDSKGSRRQVWGGNAQCRAVTVSRRSRSALRLKSGIYLTPDHKFQLSPAVRVFSNLNGEMLLAQSPASSASSRLERSVRDPQFPGLEACLRRPRCGAPATRA